MAYTSEQKQVFTELSGELGEQIQGVPILEENEIDDALLLPGTHTDEQTGVTSFVAVTFGALRRALNNFLAAVQLAWLGTDGTGETDGLKKEIEDARNATQQAVNDAQAVKIEWQGTEQNPGGLKGAIIDWFGELTGTPTKGVKKLWNDWYGGIQNTWTTWFGASNASGIRKDVADVIDGANTAKNNAQAAADEWDKNGVGLKATINNWYLGIQSAWSNWFGTSDSTGVQKQVKDAVDRAGSAATGAENVNATLSGTTITVTNRNGQSNSADLKGEKGDTGKGFRVEKTFSTKSALGSYNYSTGTTDEGGAFHKNDFVMVQSNQEDPDNARLYQLNASLQPIFICDMSGTIGLPGKTPQMATGTVNTGEPGSQAIVTVTPDGTDSNGNPKYKVNFTIPKGDKPNITADPDGTLKVDGALLTDVIKQAINTFNTNEGTSSSTAGDGTRWGAYKSAEAARDNAFSSAQNTRNNTWTEWFSDSLSTGVRKLWNDFWPACKNAWETWFGTSDNSGVRKTWSDWFGGIQSTWSTWFGTSDSTGIRKDVHDAIDAANGAAQTANTAAANAKADYVGDDNYVYHWNSTTGQYQKTNLYVKGDTGADLTWETMDSEDRQELTQQIIEASGITASIETCEAIIDELI